ncbi:MAG: PHP domain-containing protein [Dehalococcoidales bacterium]|nr:PHP domain-containing protein [Dehalococcoidales bacterium]
MKIDLHVHTSTGSDGALTLEEVLAEAKKRHIDLLSITDHDAIGHQGHAVALAERYGIAYITGVELNVTFPHAGRSVSLDFLGYGYDFTNTELWDKLVLIREYRQERGQKIMDNLNAEFRKEGKPLLTDADLTKMQEGVDGILSRPHIADYLTKKGIVSDRQEAFDKYLVKCDVPKYPLLLPEASRLIRNAGGRLSLAHPNDPNGTSLVSLTRDLTKQAKIIRENMLDYIDGVECWHSRHSAETTEFYVDFCKKNNLLMTGGSDCHQKPILLGTVPVPDFVAGQFL